MNIRSRPVFDKLDALASICQSASETTQKAIRLEYLSIVAEYLYAEGANIQTLCPLLDLHADIEASYDNQPSRRVDNERRSTEAGFNGEIMARVCAVLDVLATSGMGVERASQIVSRQMMAQNFSHPEAGGDVRGWRRVQIWYQRMMQQGDGHPQARVFQDFRAELHAKHGTNAVAAVLAQPLWDRRHMLALAG